MSVIYIVINSASFLGQSVAYLKKGITQSRYSKSYKQGVNAKGNSLDIWSKTVGYIQQWMQQIPFLFGDARIICSCKERR